MAAAGSGKVQTIVLGSDASVGAAKAAEEAVLIAHGTGAEIIVVNALKRRRRATPPSEKDGKALEAAHGACVDMVAGLREQGIRASHEVVEGPVADAILNVATAKKADLVVIGKRGHFLLGSVANRVVRNARVPVMMVGGESGAAGVS